MSVTRLRIKPDGNVTGLWDDQIVWRSLGNLTVRRASHVKFCDRKQIWFVRRARPRGVIRRIAQILFRCLFGEILYWSPSREEALAWERQHYAPGGLGWQELIWTRQRNRMAAARNTSDLECHYSRSGDLATRTSKTRLHFA